MLDEDLEYLKKWFHDYSRSFYSSDKEDRKNISLKVEHTYNVCENMVLIAKEQLSSKSEILLAETVALFHDVGRFPQYAKYRTFMDSISVNHGKLGAEILVEEKVLQNLTLNEQELIINSVKFHNAFAIPVLKNQVVIFFLKLIRDADKLDIWRVFSEYFESNKKERASAVGLGLPDLLEYSETVLSCLYDKKLASLADVKTLNDFKIIQLTWVYDLHFKTSFRLLLERDYINRIASTLPQTDEIKKTLLELKEFVSKKAVT